MVAGHKDRPSRSMNEADVIARLEYLFGDLRADVAALKLQIKGFEENEFFEDPQPIGGDGSLERWSYKVTAAGGLNYKIAPGRRVVIHKSAENDATEMTGSVSANSTSQIWAVYTYATETTAASWSGAPTVMADPGQSSARRAFLIATITSGEDSITSIVHHHVGDLEVYDLVQC